MDKIIYFNGKFIKESQAHIPITTHALHYGTGCFEGIRAYYNKKEDCLYVFRMQDHYKRMVLSTKTLFISLPHPVEKLCEITVELLKKNFLKEDIYIRPLAYKSDKAVGNFLLPKLQDGFLIYTTALGRYLNVEKGIKTNVSSWKRISDNTIPPRSKITGSYVNAALAKTESVLGGYEEAIMLDQEGHICEGSTENFFAVRNEQIITPPLSSDILLGITRDTIMKLAKDVLKKEVVERNIDRSELYHMDEVFLVGTGAEVSPVIEIDHRLVGDGKVGFVAKELKDIYFKLVHGEYPKYEDWLTKINAVKK